MIRIPYLLYFRHVLPLVGGWVSGDRRAYRYLNETVEAFPYGGPFCDEMRAAGFTNVQALPLTWGVATLYQGDKSRGKADGGDAAGVVRAYSAVSDK